MHADLASFVLGLIVGVVVTVMVDRYILSPLASFLERMERRWNGRLRPR